MEHLGTSTDAERRAWWEPQDPDDLAAEECLGRHPFSQVLSPRLYGKKNDSGIGRAIQSVNFRGAN